MNAAHSLLQGPLKRMRTLGIHTQLTLWFMTIFLLLIVLFGAIFYFHLSSGLAANLDSQLQLRAQFVSGAIIQENGTLALHDETGELSTLIDIDDPAAKGMPHHERNLAITPLDPDLDLLIQVRDTAGQMQYSTAAFLSGDDYNLKRTIHPSLQSAALFPSEDYWSGVDWCSTLATRKYPSAGQR
jgi:uncharacterized iron-regulated membrane protein